jgi:ankyrin repeat protein
MIDPLVRAGADINAYDDRGFTPIILAAYNGQLATVEALIAHGANACRPDRDQGNTAQMGVAFKGEDAIAARLLKAGCDVNARNHAGQTALMMASLFNRTRQVDMLLAAGADRSVRDAAGRTAGSIATDQGNAPMARRVTR